LLTDQSGHVHSGHRLVLRVADEGPTHPTLGRDLQVGPEEVGILDGVGVQMIALQDVDDQGRLEGLPRGEPALGQGGGDVQHLLGARQLGTGRLRGQWDRQQDEGEERPAAADELLQFHYLLEGHPGP
jgi:hypothetical protein